MAVTPTNDTVSYTDSAGKTQQAQGVVVLAGGSGGGGTADTVAVSNLRDLQVLPVAINRSGSITAGGTSQSLAALNANRTHLFIQNISDGDLWMSEYGAAAVDGSGSYRIAPGLAARVLTRNAITIVGAATGQKFTATETN